MTEERTDLKAKDERLATLIEIRVRDDYDLRPSTAKEIAARAMDVIKRYIEAETEKKA